MPRPLRSFDRMIIPAPCDADWDAMIGNERVRFCEHCHLHVTNISALPRQEAMRLVSRSEGRLCVRFMKSADGSVVTKQLPQALHQISRRVSRIAAGAFTATLSLSSAAAQTRPTNTNEPVEAARSMARDRNITEGASDTGTIGGLIYDPMGAVVPGARVILIGPSSQQIAISSEAGDYRFLNLKPGNYKLNVNAVGFTAAEITDIVIDQSPAQIDVTLEVAQFTQLSGVIVFIAPEEPLVKAVFEDNLEAVQSLAFSAPDLNVRDKGANVTALEQAVENGNVEIVRRLLMAGAHVNTKGPNGRRILMYLRENATSQLVRELLTAGAKVNARDESGATGLMYAASDCKYEVVKELLDAGAKINLKDDDGATALINAATNDDPRVTRLLIEAGADVNDKDEDGVTALMKAAESGDPETVKLLLSHGADVNAIDDDGRSAMMYIASTNDLESALALLNAGADLYRRDPHGNTALSIARENSQTEMVQLLTARGCPDRDPK